MNILLITPYFPYPPDSGGKIRLWEEIRHLGRRHRLSLVTLAEPAERQHEPVLKEYCRNVWTVVRTGQIPTQPKNNTLPLPVLWYRTDQMRETLARRASEAFDVIQFEHIFTAQYQHLFPREKTVLAEHNIESRIYARMAEFEPPDGSLRVSRKPWVHRAIAMHLAAYEDRLWPEFPLRITVSHTDRAEMDRRCRAGRSMVIENGIDALSIQPVASSPSRRILFMGAMDYHPNVDAAFFMVQEILPRILALDPGIGLVIAGRNPPPEISALAQGDRIQIVANPPHMEAIAQKCRISVVPVRAGSGTRIKILHAMALGLPVVSTTLGCEGLAVRDRGEILIADDPEDFARSVLCLLNDPDLLQSLRSNGRLLVEERYHWPLILKDLETALLSMQA